MPVSRRIRPGSEVWTVAWEEDRIEPKLLCATLLRRRGPWVTLRSGDWRFTQNGSARWHTSRLAALYWTLDGLVAWLGPYSIATRKDKVVARERLLVVSGMIWGIRREMEAASAAAGA